MEGIRRTYSEEFKKDAVGHSLISEKAVAEVAQDLGLAQEKPVYCLSGSRSKGGMRITLAPMGNVRT